jgi:glycosyltransferase involved in cell wall biosynthesis
MKPLVSVVVPYYQHLKFVERCFASITAQTYDNIELIVIDDCSPDGSGIVVEEFCKREELNCRFSGRVKFESFKKNQGAHVAINYGIQQSKGEVITVINSDDMYHANRIELVIREMTHQNAEFVFTGIRCIDEHNNDVTELHDLARHFRSCQENISKFATVGFACLASNVAISTGNFVFTKRLYDRVGDFNSYRYCHDWDFLLRALTFVEPIFLNHDLYYYRFHGKNSFESLQDVADSESTNILASYFDAVRSNTLSNNLAPSPLNWSHYFEFFLKTQKYDHRYKLSNCVSF